MPPPDDESSPATTPLLSVVATAHNEQDNIRPLVEQVQAALSTLEGGWEFVVVDDGSTDATRSIVLDLMRDRPWLRCVAMLKTPPGKGNGQSAAFHAGFRAARGRLIAVLDADLQNDPADIPPMLALLEREQADFVQGDRSHARKDGLVRRVGSRVGRLFRRIILGDTIRDTGCSLRVFRREIALALPLEFKGIHRFIPATARHLGYKVVEMPVVASNRSRSVETRHCGRQAFVDTDSARCSSWTPIAASSARGARPSTSSHARDGARRSSTASSRSTTSSTSTTSTIGSSSRRLGSSEAPSRGPSCAQVDGLPHHRSGADQEHRLRERRRRRSEASLDLGIPAKYVDLFPGLLGPGKAAKKVAQYQPKPVTIPKKQP